MRVVSGIQPSGKLHLGNFVGALAPHIDLQEEHECFYFIANYHALTTLHDSEQLSRLTNDVALDYLALGLNPERAFLFRQSDVPEVTELAWILSTVTPKSLLERAHSYKDKVAKNIPPSMGLFNYPVLMAADILIYRPDWVPVGKDQTQHVEMAQDMAENLNRALGRELLRRPESRVSRVPLVAGTDGQKMSKSYNNHIEIFAAPEVIRERIMGIKTDSLPVAAQKDPDGCNAFAILRLLAEIEEIEAWASRYRTGGVSYRDVKVRIIELFDQTFSAAREKRKHLATLPTFIEDVLQSGARRARREAIETMTDIREACGLPMSMT